MKPLTKYCKTICTINWKFELLKVMTKYCKNFLHNSTIFKLLKIMRPLTKFATISAQLHNFQTIKGHETWPNIATISAQLHNFQTIKSHKTWPNCYNFLHNSTISKLHVLKVMKPDQIVTISYWTPQFSNY